MIKGAIGKLQALDIAGRQTQITIARTNYNSLQLACFL